jgi:hypothetical protein
MRSKLLCEWWPTKRTADADFQGCARSEDKRLVLENALIIFNVEPIAWHLRKLAIRMTVSN